MHTHVTSQPDYGTGEKTFIVYTLGIVLCVILTFIPFAAVMNANFSYAKTLSIIFISALLQFFVQIICFLRLNYGTEQAKMNVMSFILSIFILVAIVAGSLWIMWNLDYYMVH